MRLRSVPSTPAIANTSPNMSNRGCATITPEHAADRIRRDQVVKRNSGTVYKRGKNFSVYTLNRIVDEFIKDGKTDYRTPIKASYPLPARRCTRCSVSLSCSTLGLPAPKCCSLTCHPPPRSPMPHQICPIADASIMRSTRVVTPTEFASPLPAKHCTRYSVSLSCLARRDMGRLLP